MEAVHALKLLKTALTQWLPCPNRIRGNETDFSTQVRLLVALEKGLKGLHKYGLHTCRQQVRICSKTLANTSPTDQKHQLPFSYLNSI